MIPNAMSKTISRTELSKSHSASTAARRGAVSNEDFESFLNPETSSPGDSKPISREETKPKDTPSHQAKRTSSPDHHQNVTVHTHTSKNPQNESSDKRNETSTEAVSDASQNDGGFDWSANQCGLNPEELAKAVEDALNNIATGDNNLTTNGNGKTPTGTNRMIRPQDMSVSDDPQSTPGDPKSREGVYDILSVEMITAGNPSDSSITGLMPGHTDISPLILSVNPEQKTQWSTDANSLKTADKIETVASDAQSISLGEVKTQTDGAGSFGQSKSDQNGGSLGTLESKIELPNSQHSKTDSKENSFVVAQENANTAVGRQVSTAAHQSQTVSGPQIIDQLAPHVKPAMTELRMVLRPDDLGTLNLKVSTQNGRIVASILASSESVKHALEQHLPQLHAALTQQGLKVSSVSVDTQTSQFSQSLMSDGNHAGGQNAMPGKPGFNVSRSESNVESVTTPVSRVSVSSNHSLNILA